MAGLLGVHDRYTEGRIKRKTLGEETATAKDFLQEYLPFDWTRALDE